MEYWFTADTHFNHRGILKSSDGWGWRDFPSVDAMNDHLVLCWNSRVKRNDFVYLLGDFGWNDCENLASQLNGQKFLIEGSHDAEGKRLRRYFVQVTPMKTVKVEGQVMVLTHCAMRVWERSHYGSWNLYGHSHGRLPQLANAMDVGVDTHNYYPYSFQEVKDNIENFKKTLDKPDGFVYNADERYSC